VKRPQQTRGRSDQRRKARPAPPSSVDVWRTPAPLPELHPIAVSRDPTALVRSLGEPPMNRGMEAGIFIGTVVERAAGIAAALAFSADQLADPER